MKAIVETAVDGIITIDERGIIESMNPAAERVFGYSHEEAVGRNVTMFMSGPEQTEHDHYLEEYLRTGQQKIIGTIREVRGRRQDGSIFPMELAVSETRLGCAVSSPVSSATSPRSRRPRKNVRGYSRNWKANAHS